MQGLVTRHPTKCDHIPIYSLQDALRRAMEDNPALAAEFEGKLQERVWQGVRCSHFWDGLFLWAGRTVKQMALFNCH
jgi:hypothetical protein